MLKLSEVLEIAVGMLGAVLDTISCCLAQKTKKSLPGVD